MDKLIPSAVFIGTVSLVLFIRYYLRPFLVEAIQNYREESKKRKRDDDALFTDWVQEKKNTPKHIF